MLITLAFSLIIILTRYVLHLGFLAFPLNPNVFCVAKDYVVILEKEPTVQKMYIKGYPCFHNQMVICSESPWLLNTSL